MPRSLVLFTILSSLNILIHLVFGKVLKHLDSKLGNHLTTFFKGVGSVVDFGCGMGKYIKTFREHVPFGNPNTPELTNGTCGILDLSLPKKFDEPFDWVMSLEVGEHLPSIFEDIFINNLHNNNKYGIILSWAVKGQGGHGHINEQNVDYIKSKIIALGYTNDLIAENEMKLCCSLWWFKNTLMVFRRN